MLRYVFTHLIILLSLTAVAENLQINLMFTDGTEESIKLTDEVSIQFNGDMMDISSTDGSVSYCITDVAGYTYAKYPTEDLDRETTPILTLYPDKIMLTNPLSTEPTIYTLEGRLIRRFPSTATTLPLMGLRPGCYIVRIDNLSFKIKVSGNE